MFTKAQLKKICHDINSEDSLGAAHNAIFSHGVSEDELRHFGLFLRREINKRSARFGPKYYPDDDRPWESIYDPAMLGGRMVYSLLPEDKSTSKNPGEHPNEVDVFFLLPRGTSSASFSVGDGVLGKGVTISKTGDSVVRVFCSPTGVRESRVFYTLVDNGYDDVVRVNWVIDKGQLDLYTRGVQKFSGKTKTSEALTFSATDIKVEAPKGSRVMVISGGVSPEESEMVRESFLRIPRDK